MTATRAHVGEIAGLHHRFDPAPQGLAYAEPAPAGAGWTLLLLHGTGGDEHQLGELGRQLLPAAAQLAPRGQVLEQGAPRFFARTGLNRFDPAQVIEGVDALAGFIGAAVDAYGIDQRKLVAVGYSNGANAALGAMQRHPGLLRGAVLLRAMPVLDPPPAGTPLQGTSLLALAGARDPLVPAAVFEQLAETTRNQGAELTVNVEAGAGHELTTDDVHVATQWLRDLTGAPVA